MLLQFRPSQIGSSENHALPYTASPISLLLDDFLLGLRCFRYAPGILLPLRPSRLSSRNELRGTRENLVILVIHIALIIGQLGFIISLLFCVMLPIMMFVTYFMGAILVNFAICSYLNGMNRLLISQPVKHPSAPEDEYWVFINGVAAGQLWLQDNIDRLAQVFGREVVGVHNPTWGIVFDLIQCLIERNFTYAVEDVRQAYVVIKQALLDAKYKKVVLILHSQGGIEGGLVTDWLLDEVPQDLLEQLEVYTFASAANHFNNPYTRACALSSANPRGESAPKSKVIRYIEHYANSRDFVSQFGVLHFAHIRNRYMGRLFVQDASGHMLNQHYLDTMFASDADGRTLDANEFMDSEIPFPIQQLGERGNEEGIRSTIRCSHGTSADDIRGTHGCDSYVTSRAIRVKDVSRLWLYRNGMSPPGER